MTSDDANLHRFVAAQDAGGTYTRALNELRRGRKDSHWMWFVFPQIAGLGQSATAITYAVANLAEARAYLAHPVLAPRLLECAAALTALDNSDPIDVFGGIDAIKLRSSMTLFAHAAPDAETKARFTAVLDQYFGGQQDPATLARL